MANFHYMTKSINLQVFFLELPSQIQSWTPPLENITFLKNTRFIKQNAKYNVGFVTGIY
jgi:hypothetical protein